MGVRVRQKDGVWYIFVNHKGKRKAKRVGTDKKVAQAAAKEIQRRLACGDYQFEEKASNSPTLRDYGERWLGYIEATRKPNTHRLYRDALQRDIFPMLGKKTLAEVTRTDIKDLIAKKLGEGLAPATVELTLATLRGLLNHALEDGLIDQNVALKTGKFLPKGDVRDEADFLTAQELSCLLETARVNYRREYPLLLCLARTGMRIGEAVAVKWEDIDFNDRFIKVRRSYNRGRVSTTKSGKSRRVEMSLQLAETLKALLKQRKEETLRNGWGQVPEWVFCTEKGSLYNSDRFRHVFGKVLRKAGLRRIRIHDLRHTYASLLLSQRAPLVFVKEQLGHHSIKMTVDIYGHLMPGEHKGEVDRLDDPLFDNAKRNLYATDPQEKTGAAYLTD